MNFLNLFLLVSLILPANFSNASAKVINTWEDAQKIQDLAKAIAGHKDPEEKSFKEHSIYNQFVHEKWDRLKELSLNGAILFEEKELSQKINSPKQIFYPFGGPDMVYPLILFPKAKTYILVGLEPAGSIEGANQGLDYAHLQKVMSNIFNSGFFVTDRMNYNLKEFGTLPVLLGLISKMGYIPTRIEEVVLEHLPGIKIDFESSTGEKKELYYYSGDLRKIDPSIFGPSDVGFIKCCSYFMHGNDFPKLKNYLLNIVPFLLQDDTGIPYTTLKNASKEVTLYGFYEKPYGQDFPWAKQSLLAEHYKNKEKVKDLGFRIGYGFGRAPSNLQLATQKTGDAK